MNNELNKENLKHVWTGYDSASLEYVIFKFSKLPKKGAEIEYLDKIDDSVRKAKIENIFRNDGYVSLEVYDYILKGYRSFELEKGSKTVMNEISDHEPVKNKHHYKKSSFQLFLWKIFPALSEEKQIERIRIKLQKMSTEDRLNLLSPYSIDECYRRLADAVDKNPGSYFSSNPVVGKIIKTHIKIKKNLKNNKYNSFQRILNALIEKHAKGTIIKGCFGIPDASKYFMYFWFCFIISLSIINVIAFIDGSQKTKFSWIFALINIGMLIHGVILVKFGKFISRNEQAFLKKFLMELLDAEEI